MIIKLENKIGVWHYHTNSVYFDLDKNTVTLYNSSNNDRFHEVAVTNAKNAQNAHFDSIAAGERIFDLTPYQATETKPK